MIWGEGKVQKFAKIWAKKFSFASGNTLERRDLFLQ